MRKFAKWMVFLITSIFMLPSCKEEPDQSIIIKLGHDKLEMMVGDTYSFNVTIDKGNIDKNLLEWESNDSKVVEVNDLGELKALSVGEAEISVRYESKIYATCNVVVKAIDVTSIKLNVHELTLSTGQGLQLEATINPSNATYKGIVWESSNQNIALVSSDGFVEGISVGEATIKVMSTVDSAIFDECLVKVKPQEVTGIICQKSALILLGTTVQLEAEVVPNNATNKTIIWSSSNPDIASVDDDGAVTGVAYGNAIVTAKTLENGYEAQCNIEVSAIDNFVTVSARAGSEGSSWNGYYSYLRLRFNTNVEEQVYIETILLNDENGVAKGYEEPNIWCSEYSTKFITQYQDTTNPNTFPAEGWVFYIAYNWNDTQYLAKYIVPKGGGWFF